MVRAGYSHVIGIDDAPFERHQRRDVPIIGAVFSGLRLEGVLCDRVRRDGMNSTRVVARMIQGSKFAAQLQLVLLQGIALAGFNVIDLYGLHEQTGLPILVVARRRPNLAKIKAALLSSVPGGRRKWSLIERLGPMEPAASVFVQRAGITLDEAERVICGLAVHGKLPEPLRTAHLIAGGLVAGQSRGRP
ncbi:MAG: DUF99 family protein [Gemmatimonadota bacterium]|nr:MAG: DUF99 family protein [Gemmatimonadota bacterium]